VIPAYWHEGLPGFLWQVMLHAFVMGLVFYAWALRVRLPSGRVRRGLLALLLVLPLVTAAVPGRTALEFRGQTAWLDSGRVLAIPLGVGSARLYHLVLAIAIMTAVLTIWQELVPALGRRSRPATRDAPDDFVRFARGLPGWDRCEVRLTPAAAILMATAGWIGPPRLLVSQGTLDRLTEAEQRAAVRHEHAHWKPDRRLRMHALFAVRLLQAHNPVALWAFREYCLEEEIACDAEAAAQGDRTSLARALLAVYGATNRRDVAARSALRKRVDILLEAGPDDGLPTLTILGAAGVMLVVLPWIV